jgi:hypothetical protein
MKNQILVVLAVFAIAACSQKSADQKVADQVSKVYPLNADERNMASINAKQFFEKEWLPAGGKRGQVISCRPTDSNYNGLVSCTGFIPQQNGSFAEVKRYCGYKPEVVGCSDEDTVK